jgi:tetratricopeptide (TPR) repeat protein
MSDEVNKLLQEGIALLKKGDRSKAADVLKKAVEIDSENVEVWSALAQALDDPEEKRIALTTILQLDPENEIAKTDLIETEQKAKSKAADEEVYPGITRKEMRRTMLTLAAFTVVVCGITLLITSTISGNRERNLQEVIAQEQAVEATNTAIVLGQTEIFVEQETQSFFATETLLAQVSPTPTATNTPQRILPTPIPPTATATEFVSRVAPLPPGNLTGRILGWGGRLLGGNEFLDMSVMSPTSGEATRPNEDLVASLTADDNFNNILYIRQLGGLGDDYTILYLGTADPNFLLGLDFSNPIFAIGGLEIQNPQLNRSGTHMVASAEFSGQRGIVIVDTATRTGIRITREEQGVSYPSAAMSPDGTTVIAVKESATGTDLVAINLTDATYPQTQLTNDNVSVTEAFPSFSSDGRFIVFQGYGTNPADNDIYRAQFANGALTDVQVLVSTASDETRPVLSPDGGFVAYTNNVTGIENTFIFDIGNRETYQLTDLSNPIYTSGWVR